MEFWLQGAGGSLQLPVKPSEYNISVSSNNTVVNVIRTGDINLKGKTGLRAISLSSFFPSKAYNFTAGTIPSPTSCVTQIEAMRNSDTPCRVIITDVLNMECTIESFTYGERDATGDIYYTISIQEYKKPIAQTVSSAGGESTRTAKKPEESSGKTYTVKKGDCLWKISKQFYGKGSEYSKIYDANKNIISDPNKIYVGQVLTIP